MAAGQSFGLAVGGKGKGGDLYGISASRELYRGLLVIDKTRSYEAEIGKFECGRGKKTNK